MTDAPEPLERCPRLREMVSAGRRQLPPVEVYPTEPWRIVERGFMPTLLAQMETIFCTANGYLGIRGTPEEGAPVHDPGTYLNGFYELSPIVYGEEAYGFAKTGQTMLRVPDGTFIKLYVDDEPLELAQARIRSFHRSLDLRLGTLERDIEFETVDGKHLQIRSRRFVSLEQRHLACLLYEVRMLEGGASLVIASELVSPATVEPPAAVDPRRVERHDGQRVLLPSDRRACGLRVLLNLQARSSGLRMACAMDHLVESDVRVDVEEAECLEDRGRVVFLAELRAGQSVRVVKLLSYHHSDSAEPGELRFRTNRTLDRARTAGFDALLAAHRREVDGFWEHADVVIEGEPEVQQALRFNLFQILQASARSEGFGIPAKGLSGLGYEGHYFWDTEIYVLPFLTYTNPHVAASLLDTRYHQLPRARKRAREVGQAGALYPWRTINGDEASAYYAAGTAQYHINADIAFAADRYVAITGDEGALHRGLAEVYVETARLWVDLGFYSERKGGRFCINGVTGPDEYNAVVNNNAYTNLMARENLEIAVRAVRRLEQANPRELARLAAETGLDLSEVSDWEKAASRMYIPYDEKAGVHLQDDDFLDREVWNFENTPEEHYPLLLHYHPLVIYRHQVIKQADLVLATFLLGQRFSQEEKRRIFDYYDPLTTGDSSLSVCIQSIMASELGYEDEAYRYFADAVAMDLGDIGGNVAHGMHIASLAGTWMALVYGFAGLREREGRLSFRPRLPRGWRRLCFRLRVQQQTLEIDVRRDEVHYTLVSGSGLELHHGSHPVRVDPAAPAVMPQCAVRTSEADTSVVERR